MPLLAVIFSGVLSPPPRGRSQPRFLPRSRHLPVIPFAGSRTENLNAIGVRLWIDSSLYQALVEQSDSLWSYQRIIRDRLAGDPPRRRASKPLNRGCPWSWGVSLVCFAIFLRATRPRFNVVVRSKDVLKRSWPLRAEKLTSWCCGCQSPLSAPFSPEVLDQTFFCLTRFSVGRMRAILAVSSQAVNQEEV
jgi:hypothetical protein